MIRKPTSCVAVFIRWAASGPDHAAACADTVGSPDCSAAYQSSPGKKPPVQAVPVAQLPSGLPTYGYWPRARLRVVSSSRQLGRPSVALSDASSATGSPASTAAALPA